MFDYEVEIQSHNLPVDSIAKLAIFDFDSTLFKSPLPSQELWTPSFVGTIISDCQWFSDHRTLAHPYLPLSPNDDWWNIDIVSKAKTSLTQKDTLTVLLTGRRKQIFHDRILELCKNRDDPLEFHLYS